jgi:hypothetical protein
LRDATTIKITNLTLETYRILRILAAAKRLDARLTLLGATDLVRGVGGGTVSMGTGSTKTKTKIDIIEEAGGKITLSKDVAAFLSIVYLV